MCTVLDYQFQTESFDNDKQNDLDKRPNGYRPDLRPSYPGHPRPRQKQYVPTPVPVYVPVNNSNPEPNKVTLFDFSNLSNVQLLMSLGFVLLVIFIIFKK